MEKKAGLRERKMGETAYECGLKEEVSRLANKWMVMLFSHEIQSTGRGLAFTGRVESGKAKSTNS